MELLVISNNPNRASFRQRIGMYIDGLAKAGVNCTVKKLPKGFFARRSLYRSTADFDGVFLHKKGLNFFDASYLRKHARKIIYDFDDAVMYSPSKPEIDSGAHFNPFRRTAGFADVVIAGNSYLAEHASRFNNNIHIIPTGLDTQAYKKTAQKKDSKIRLVWIGSKSTLRYLQQLKPALEKIGSECENVVLRIICDEFFELDNMTVEQCTWSKESEIDDLIGGDIGLSPLPDNRFARGKCGFKILQYAAASLPVIASPVGVNADFVKDGITGFLVNDLSEWTEKIKTLVEDVQLRQKMGRQNLEFVKKYDKAVTGEQLTEIIKKCLSPAYILKRIVHE